jgi:tannase/feruloyl esterase
MRRFLSAVALAVAASVAGTAVAVHVGAAASGTACGDLAGLAIPDVTIMSAGLVAEGSFTPPGSTRALTVKTFCRVAATASPSNDSQIAIEVWLPPAGAWNGKLLGTGNGGFSGSIGYPAMAAAIARGYAAVGTDGGHSGDQIQFALGHPEKVVDWAYRSVHVMTDVAKLAVRNHQGRFPERSYFEGCSTGGQQALSEVQRFPSDYDGVVAGDPAYNRVRLILGFLWSWTATHTDDGRPLLSQAKLSAISDAVVAACDAIDGTKDGQIDDPRRCTFDPAVMACRGGESDSCLTPPQVAAVKKVYEGTKNSRTGERVFPGWIRGSERGWGTYITNPGEPSRVDFFRIIAFRDPKWNWRTFDWDRDISFVEAQVPFLSATSRDLSAFRSRGGKIVMYTGWSDPVVPPEDTVKYYEDVVKATGGLASTQKFFRFFPAPGMGHCGGGTGPNSFDALTALEQWVEKDAAPQHLIATRAVNGAVDRTRPLCAYPAVARYKGTGSIDAAASFACSASSPDVKPSSSAR